MNAKAEHKVEDREEGPKHDQKQAWKMFIVQKLGPCGRFAWFFKPQRTKLQFICKNRLLRGWARRFEKDLTSKTQDFFGNIGQKMSKIPAGLTDASLTFKKHQVLDQISWPTGNFFKLRLGQKKLDMFRNWPFVKNSHFCSYHHETWWKKLNHMTIIFTKFYEDRI